MNSSAAFARSSPLSKIAQVSGPAIVVCSSPNAGSERHAVVDLRVDVVGQRYGPAMFIAILPLAKSCLHALGAGGGVDVDGAVGRQVDLRS